MEGLKFITQTYYNDGSNKNRRIAISWLQDNTASQIGGDKVLEWSHDPAS